MTTPPTLRELAIDAIKQAINALGMWLPPAGREAAADAVLALVGTAAGYCPHCGRGDAAPPPADQYEQQRKRAEQAYRRAITFQTRIDAARSPEDARQPKKRT